MNVCCILCVFPFHKNTFTVEEVSHTHTTFPHRAYEKDKNQMFYTSKATKHNQTWFYNLLSLTHLKKSKTECNRVEKQKSFEKLYKRHFSYEMMPSDIFLLIIFVCAYVIVQHFTIFFSFNSCCLVVAAFKL